MWVEVFDLETERWVHADPMKTRVWDNNEEINKKIHGMPPLFITSFQKYFFKDEETAESQDAYHRYYLSDVTVNYVDRWHKVNVSRRELGLDYWWQQICSYFKFNQDLTFCKQKIGEEEEEGCE